MACCSTTLRARRALTVAGLLLTTACADRAASPTAVSTADSTSASLGAVQEVARGLALGLANEAARFAVLNALRASPYVEHKVVLREFIATPEGEALLTAVHNAGVDRERLQTLIDEMPPMDFYAPFRDHRLEWTGASGVAVGATLNVDDPALIAFTEDGGALPLDARNGLPPKMLLLIHPAEARLQRSDAPMTTAGAAIQQIGEKENAGALVPSMEGVEELTFQPPPPPPIDTTYLDQFQIFFSDWWGASEIEFRSTFWTGTEDCCWYISRHTGIQPNYIYQGPWPIVLQAPRWVGQYVNVNLVETDNVDPDDWHGLTLVSEPGIYRMPTDPSMSHRGNGWFRFSDRSNPARVTRVTVAPSSATLSVGGSVALTATAYDQNDNVMDWKTFTWSSSNSGVATVASTDYNTATVTAVGGGYANVSATSDGVSATSRITVPWPGLPVSLSGPTRVKPYATCGYWASVSSGSGNYRYSWSTGTSTTNELQYKNQGSSHTISVTVTDLATAQYGSASRSVSVNSSNPACVY